MRSPALRPSGIRNSWSCYYMYLPQGSRSFWSAPRTISILSNQKDRGLWRWKWPFIWKRGTRNSTRGPIFRTSTLYRVVHFPTAVQGDEDSGYEGAKASTWTLFFAIPGISANVCFGITNPEIYHTLKNKELIPEWWKAFAQLKNLMTDKQLQGQDSRQQRE